MVGRYRCWLWVLLGSTGCTAIPNDGFQVGAGASRADAPVLMAFETLRAPLGSAVRVVGANFPDASKGRTVLVFDGTYTSYDGQTVEAFQSEEEVRRSDPTSVTWDRFGPYDVPFSTQNKLGYFDGRVSARAYVRDEASGEEVMLESPSALDIRFEVLPSIRVLDFQPYVAGCNGPVLRGLTGVPYRMRVQALGFTPRSFTYRIDAPGLNGALNVEGRPTTPPAPVTIPAEGSFNSVGPEAELIFPDVPEDRQSYSAVVTVQAQGADGQIYQNAFALRIHEPFQLIYDGRFEIAERYPADPQSGCIEGGLNSSRFTHRQLIEQTAERRHEVQWNTQWRLQVDRENSSAETRGNSSATGAASTNVEQTDLSFTTSTGRDKQFGIPARLAITLSEGENNGITETDRKENSESSLDQLSQASTSTDRNNVVNEEAGARVNNYQVRVSSSNQRGLEFERFVPGGFYGRLYLQKERIIRRMQVVSFNYCGRPSVAGTVEFHDFLWAPQIGLGPACDPPPTDGVPAAECRIPPCDTVVSGFQ